MKRCTSLLISVDTKRRQFIQITANLCLVFYSHSLIVSLHICVYIIRRSAARARDIYGLKNYLTLSLASDACFALDDCSNSSKGTGDDLLTLICFAVVTSWQK